MGNIVNIDVDTMGGENAPHKIIEGIEISLQSNQENIRAIELRISDIDKRVAELNGLLKNVDSKSKDYFSQKKVVDKLKSERNILSERIELYRSLEMQGLIMYSQDNK